MKKVKPLCCIVALIATAMLTNTNMQAQVTIGSGVKPGKAALLDLKTKEGADGAATTGEGGGGLLLPRVTLQSFTSLKPFAIDDTDTSGRKYHKGLIVYNLADTNGFAEGPYSWDGTQWLPFAGAGGIAYTGTSPVTVTGNTIGLTDGTASGQVLKWDGTQWKAGTDANDNTTYSGSTSVALSGTSFQRAALTGDVTAAANSNATTIANDAVTSVKILDGTVALADLADNSVNSSKIVDASVATADLANLAVTNAKLAANSVTTDKIMDNSITQDDIQNAGNAGEVLMSKGTGTNAVWTPLSSVPGAGTTVYSYGRVVAGETITVPAGYWVRTTGYPYLTKASYVESVWNDSPDIETRYVNLAYYGVGGSLSLALGKYAYYIIYR